jgi:carboxypeptidase Q
MIKRWLLFALLGSALPSFADDFLLVTNYSDSAQQLITAATNSDFAFRRLAEFCDTFGPRLSGSTNLEKAIDWVLAEMKKDGLENVHGEDVMVPHWVRGAESCELLEPRYRKMPMFGLGGSIATTPDGITADVLVVTNFADLENRAADAKGKIVLINQPFTTYDDTVRIRTQGAVRAARAGAIASLVRSVTPYSLQSPHTGGMRYSNDVVKIPHAAISLEDADMFQRMQDRGQKIVVRLKMNAETLPDAKSRNVIGEIIGREKPDEIVVVSGHIDSWDVGQGAMDDGGGAVAAWEAVRLMHKLGLRPRRTVRVVLWTNEENGLRGARTYRAEHKAELAKHVLAIESDQGPFKPEGFAFSGSDKAAGRILEIGKILGKIEAGHITLGSDDADVSELASEGVPAMDLVVERSKYFYYHHTDADTMDKLDPHDLSRCAAAMAVMSHIVADMPETLPR